MIRPLLVLRPAPGAAATVAAAEALGLVAVARPLFEIVPMAWSPPDAGLFDAVMLSSANAARAAGPDVRHYVGLPLFAVGAKTAAAALRLGLHATHVATDLATLLPIIVASRAIRILHLGGVDRIAVDPAPLRITAVPVYVARQIDPPPPLADAAAHVVLLHSPRAATRFAALAPDRANTPIAAISAAALAAAGDGWAATGVAATPDDAALLAAAARLCQ